MATATELQLIPTLPDSHTVTERDGRIEIASREWLISIESDSMHGHHYWASRLGVMWASGWARTTNAKCAELIAKAAGSQAYMAHVLNGGAE